VPVRTVARVKPPRLNDESLGKLGVDPPVALSARVAGVAITTAFPVGSEVWQMLPAIATKPLVTRSVVARGPGTCGGAHDGCTRDGVEVTEIPAREA
jgi:hypothetical protein